MKNILVIGAHFDDSELGVGGTAARMVAEGKTVYKITLTDTEVFSDDMELSITHESCIRESAKACSILGVKELSFPFSAYGDLKFTKELMQKLEKVIAEYDIDTMFMQHYNDFNSDHVFGYQLCKTAARHCPNLLTYQSNGYILDEPFEPNFFVDITDYLEQKKQALMSYQAQHNRQGRLFQMNIERNSIWGYGNHVDYAEGFHVIKMCI